MVQHRLFFNEVRNGDSSARTSIDFCSTKYKANTKFPHEVSFRKTLHLNLGVLRST